MLEKLEAHSEVEAEKLKIVEERRVSLSKVNVVKILELLVPRLEKTCFVKSLYIFVDENLCRKITPYRAPGGGG